MIKKILIGVAVLGAACAIIIPRVMKKEPFAEAVADPVVEIASPERRDISLQTALVGKVEPEDVVYVYPKASGEVTEVKIKAGEQVEEGELLCVVDTKQVDSAKSSLDAASLALSQAKEELSRQTILYQGGGISEQAYKQYQDNVKSAQISYDNAKTNYDNQVSYSQITAPISGVVELCNIEVFDQVSPSDLLCVISGPTARVVSFSVTERIRGYLREGDGITVEKDGSQYEGEITEISYMADTETGLYKVKARLSMGKEEKILSTGSSVKLYVVSEKTENAMAVPVDAVYYDGGLAYVYTYDAENESLHKVQVETGTADEEWIEILSGIDMDTQVLTTWSSELYEGTKVRVKGEAAAENVPAGEDPSVDGPEADSAAGDIRKADIAETDGLTEDAQPAGEGSETENSQTDDTESEAGSVLPTDVITQ